MFYWTVCNSKCNYRSLNDYFRQEGIVFSAVRLSVCLSVSEQDYGKTTRGNSHETWRIAVDWAKVWPLNLGANLTCHCTIGGATAVFLSSCCILINTWSDFVLDLRVVFAHVPWRRYVLSECLSSFMMSLLAGVFLKKLNISKLQNRKSNLTHLLKQPFIFNYSFTLMMSELFTFYLHS